MTGRASDAVAAAIGAGEGPIEVAGDGRLAEDLRQRLGAAPAGAGDARPLVVVETTGRGEANGRSPASQTSAPS